MYFAILVIALTVVGVPLAFIIVIARTRAELHRLRNRVERLEYLQSRERPAAIPASSDPAATLPAPAPPAPTLVAPPAPPLPEGPAVASARTHSHVNLEQLIGGVWLQNIGSVLLLVGVFLMILWGYNTHRLGPWALVAGGVGLGLALVWRGDWIARTVPPFGHSLIGIGVGIVYLTLYLGHVRLGVLPSWLTFLSLVTVSFGSVLAGTHYRVRLIASLGVIGAYLPFFMAAWLPLAGLWTNAPWLLTYMAIVNGYVIVMAARAGWSGLDVSALLLATLAWISSFHSVAWGWSIQIGLSLLFTLLGLAPLPRLVGAAGRVRPVDLAAIILAPFCLVAASWPFLAYGDRVPVAVLLIVLAIVQFAAALWVDTRRPERDLWRPLTAAAILFLAAALERALGTERAPIAWCLEGLFLVALGLTPAGGGWLRAWGSVVVALGALAHLSMVMSIHWTPEQWPVFYTDGARGLIVWTTVLIGGLLLSRRRDRLSRDERWTPEAWTALGHLLLAIWIGQEGGHVASWMFSGPRPMAPPGAPVGELRSEMALALCGAAWMAQAGLVALSAPRQGGAFLRWCATLVAGLALVVVTVRHVSGDPWSPSQPLFFDPTTWLELVTIGIAVAASIRLSALREADSPSTRWMPEIWAAAASVMLMMWSSREAAHLAGMLLPAAGSQNTWERERQWHTAAAAITSGAWLVEATLLLVTGWIRRSPFLRWSGLALFGLVALKFLFLDLQTVDVFWRFLTAIALGAAMLAISYHYRRRSRTAAAAE